MTDKTLTVTKKQKFTSLLQSILYFALASIIGTKTQLAQAMISEKPNIIIIMADDMGWSDIGCYGGEIQTPNIDRLATEGLRLTQFYNNAKCTTTRASLMTGLYPRNGGRGIRLLNDKMVTISEILKGAGYQTALSGKWHLGSKKPNRPIDRGFDEYYGLMDGCCSYFNPIRRDPDFKGGRIRVFGHNNRIREKPFPENYYATDAFTDHAIKTIRRFSDNQTPFFLNISYTAPHYPLHAKSEDIAKYKGKYLGGWDQLRQDRHRRLIKAGLVDPNWQIWKHDPKAYAWNKTNPVWEDLRMATYAGMIDSMDQNIGRILQTLEELDIIHNTLIMFLSDNGGCAEEPGGRDMSQVPGLPETYTAVGPSWGWAQNTPFRRYKARMYEGGIATPFIAYWPDMIKANTMTNQVGHIIDLLPTFLDIVDKSYPKTRNGISILPVEGLSLLPIFQGKQRAGHQTLYWHFSNNHAVRQAKWKLVWDKSFKQWELYDLIADRTESHNLAASYPDRVKQMQMLYQTWAILTDVEAPIPTRSK